MKLLASTESNEEVGMSVDSGCLPSGVYRFTVQKVPTFFVVTEVMLYAKIMAEYLQLHGAPPDASDAFEAVLKRHAPIYATVGFEVPYEFASPFLPENERNYLDGQNLRSIIIL